MTKPEPQYENNVPVCPYCWYKDFDVWETHRYNPHWMPGEKLEVKCPDCEREYTLVWNISYDTEPKEESK